MPRILPIEPASYTRHRIHRGERCWAETNCYSDVIIELLHGLGFEPMAALPFTLTIDFDLDQWTFFKFPYADIELLYALGIHELAPWRPLVDHLEENVRAGRPVLVELDSFFLPDTAGTAYKLAHVKSTVAVNEIDPRAQILGYFHNQGYHVLHGQDFAGIFQTAGLVHERMLPPYIEFVKPVPRQRPLEGADQVEGSLQLLRRHLGRLPEQNPFVSFRDRLGRDMDWLLGAEIETFHAYSFATLRQLGACFELASTYLGWLGEQGVDGLEAPGQELDQISQSAKATQLRLARSMARKKPLDLGTLDEMAAGWERAMGALTRRFG